MASMLDELMGRNRDQPPDQKGKEKTWDDTQVINFWWSNFPLQNALNAFTICVSFQR